MADPSAGATAGSTPQIVQYSACRTKAGYIFCFVQDGQRIYARKSCDNGTTWAYVLSPQTSLFPQVPGSGTIADPDAPMCFYDKGAGSVILFSMMDSAILMMKIPEAVFLLSQSAAAEAIAKIVPQIVYGKQSANLLSRGIACQSTVISRQKNNSTLSESVSPHRVAIARTDIGCIRMFFMSQAGFMSSLISSDGGTLWLSEGQYIGTVPVAPSSTGT
jgi:hypothetical protein